MRPSSTMGRLARATLVVAVVGLAYVVQQSRITWFANPDYFYVEESFDGNPTFAILAFLDATKFRSYADRVMERVVVVGKLDEYLQHSRPDQPVLTGAERYDRDAQMVEVEMFIKEASSDRIILGWGFLVGEESLEGAQQLAAKASARILPSHQDFVVRAVQLGPGPAVVWTIPWNWVSNKLYFVLQEKNLLYADFLGVLKRNGKDVSEEKSRWSRVKVLLKVEKKGFPLLGMKSLDYFSFVSEFKSEESRLLEEIYGSRS